MLLARLTLGADNALVPYYALLLVLVTSGWHQLWRRTLLCHSSTWGAQIEPNEAAVERPERALRLEGHARLLLIPCRLILFAPQALPLELVRERASRRGCFP